MRNLLTEEKAYQELIYYATYGAGENSFDYLKAMVNASSPFFNIVEESLFLMTEFQNTELSWVDPDDSNAKATFDASDDEMAMIDYSIDHILKVKKYSSNDFVYLFLKMRIVSGGGDSQLDFIESYYELDEKKANEIIGDKIWQQDDAIKNYLLAPIYGGKERYINDNMSKSFMANNIMDSLTYFISNFAYDFQFSDIGGPYKDMVSYSKIKEYEEYGMNEWLQEELIPKLLDE